VKIRTGEPSWGAVSIGIHRPKVRGLFKLKVSFDLLAAFLLFQLSQQCGETLRQRLIHSLLVLHPQVSAELGAKFSIPEAGVQQATSVSSPLLVALQHDALSSAERLVPRLGEIFVTIGEGEPLEMIVVSA
jgi:hypothetical protein